MTKKFISPTFCICSIIAFILSASLISPVNADKSETLYLLSGNALTDADKALYFDLGMSFEIADTGADYEFIAGDSELITYDSFGPDRGQRGNVSVRKLNSGNLQTGGNLTTTWSQWANGTQAVARFDLGGVYSVSQVDVWEHTRVQVSHIWKVGAIEVWAGETEDSMVQVWTGNSPCTISEADAASGKDNIFERAVATFAAKDARYIDVKMQKSGGVTIGETAYGCYQMRPAEVLIFGTAANGETEIAAKKTIAKAEEYLAFESLYTAATVATLKTAVADLVDGDYADAEDTQFLIEEVEAAIAGLQNAVTYYTLSGNKWNDVTKNSFYSVWDPDLELVTGTNAASYTWNTKDPELPVNDANQPADANTKEMIDGHVNSFGTNTKWDANYYNTILFDLGEKSIVDRVDIAHHIYGNAARYMLGEVVVQTSLDGNNYISAVSGQGDPTAANMININNGIALDSFSFTPRAARYVRVTFKKLPSAHSVRPMEIAVFGYEDPDRPYISNIFGEVNENNTFGAIEFDACFQNYDKRDVEEFGIYVYKDGNTEEGIKKYISENATIALKTNQGIFSTIINNIPAEKFHEKIFAMPYVIIEGKSYRGTVSSASVNDFQHN